ncbi:hypothetical protein C8R44DRAFT_648412, partial [Mycena epipterygia]
MSTTNLPAATRPRSRLDMPALRTRGAPKKFSGSPHDVLKFIAHLEKLFVQNGVTTDLDKVECMAEYCSRKVVHIFEGMKNYTTPNWSVLITDMETMFDADKDQQRHRPHDLKKLTDSWRKYNIKSMSEWRRYIREFTTIAGWLIHHKLMEETECATYLWHGMHPNLRLVAENRLLAKNPTRDMSIPFPRDDIIGVISARFKRGRFDAELDSDSSDSDDDSSDSESDLSSDSEISDSDDNLPPRRKPKKTKAKIKKRRTTRGKTSAPAAAPVVPNAQPKPAARSDNSADVGELVKQLSRMNIEDAEYNYLYYRATSLDPHVAKCVRAPALSTKAPPLPPNNYRGNQYVPPTNQYGSNTNANMNGPPADRSCYGCGDKGHGLWDCAKIAEALATGEIRRGERGIEWSDGNLLRRFNSQGETLLAAYQRQRQEIATIFAITRSSDKAPRPAPYPAPATRNQPATRAEVKRTGGTLESMPMDGPTSIQAKQEAMEDAAIPDPIPADPIQMRVDFSRNDAIMEDVISDAEEADAEPVYKAKGSAPPKISKKPGPRQSAVSSHVNPQEVMNAILNSEVKLSTGQVLAVAPGIANALIEVLKLKNAPRPVPAATIIANMMQNIAEDTPLNRLIQMQVVIGGKTVNAIVDTGSMLNVVSRGAWRNLISHISMDITKHINMGDANGGQSQLRGYLKDVPLTMGGVESTASFWVGDKVPFEVLLGRPWQRGNYVSIDERRDGTYLVF